MGQFLAGIGSFVASIAFVLLFAWAARAFLDARELTWKRLTIAALAGISIGNTAAALLLVDELTELPRLTEDEFVAVSLPFVLIATMGAVVVLELLFARPRQAKRRSRFRPFRSLRVGVGIVGRFLQVSRIMARHGLAPVLGLRRGGVPQDPAELARRTRTALEEAGGMFIKLGQLLATRPDLVPPEAQRELARLHSSAAPLDRATVERLVEDQIGRPVDRVFADVDWEPLGSASIAQAHAARLLDGSPVVMKVRRPGLGEIVARDLAITRWLARTANRRTEWGKTLDVEGLAEEFADTLEDELDFRIEARSIQEVAEGARGEALVHVPRIYPDLTAAGLLVMERLAGTPFSQLSGDERFDGRALADALTKSQVGAMLQGERFHGDPHPGNILLLEDGRIGLIDLGISGRLDAFERASVFQMLVAIRLEQPTLLYESMVSIGAVDPAVHDPDQIERAFARFMAAYLGPGLPPPEALTDLMRMTTEMGLRLPRSTMAMFRALATLTGTLEHISPGYPVIEAIADLGGVEFRRRLMPESAAQYLKEEWAQLGPLLSRLPRHVDRIATMLEHGRIAGRVRLFSETEDRHFVQQLVNRFVLSLLSIGTGVVSAMLLSMETGAEPTFLGGVGLLEVLGWIGLFVAVSLLLRVLLQVLRGEAQMRRR